LTHRKIIEARKKDGMKKARGRERSGRRGKGGYLSLPFPSLKPTRRRSERPPGIPRGREQAATKEIGASQGRASSAGAALAAGCSRRSGKTMLPAVNARKAKAAKLIPKKEEPEEG
jgi:hypothetical protein